MDANKTPVRASEFYNKNNSEPVLSPGTMVTHKLTGEKLLIFQDLTHDLDDPAKEKVGTKYLTRTADHKKKVVFSCEIVATVDNGKGTSHPQPHTNK